MSILSQRDPFRSFRLPDPFRDVYGGDDSYRQPRLLFLGGEGRELRRLARLGNITRGALGGLGYLGSVLDKPSRAIRGALAGNPREALAILPLSDTFGVTREEQAVSGRDLLEQYGLLGQNTEGLDWGDVGGFAAEVALDPLTYLGVGALTKAGQAASKAGTLTKGFAPGIRAGEKALLGVGLPFAEPLGRIGTGPLAQKVAGGLDVIGQAAKRSLPVRYLRRALDPSALRATSIAGQESAADVIRPASEAAEAALRGRAFDARQAADAILGLHPRLGPRLLTEATELAGTGRFPATPADYLADLAARNPRLAAEVQQIPDLDQRLAAIWPDLGTRGQEIADIGKTAYGMTTGEGVDLSDLQDVINYLPARLEPPPQVPETWGEWAARMTGRAQGTPPAGPGARAGTGAARRRAFETGHPSLMARDPIYKGFPGGRTQINDLISKGNVTPDEVYDILTGGAAVNKNSPEWHQAVKFSEKVAGLDPRFAAENRPFFAEDPIGSLMLMAARTGKSVGSAKGIIDAIGKTAQDAAAFAGEPSMKVKDVLFNAGLKHVDQATGTSPAWEKAAQALRHLGVKNVDDLDNFAIPKDVADDITRWTAGWQRPAELEPIVTGYDKLTNLFKGWVTTPFPAFHSRNIVNGMYSMWRDNAFSTEALFDAGRLMLGDKSLDPFLKEIIAHKVAFTHGASQTADVFGGASKSLFPDLPKKQTAGQALAAWAKGWKEGTFNPLDIAGVKSTQDANRLMKQMRKLGTSSEDWMRTAHYLAKRKAGFTPEQAALAVKKYHFDYSDLTDLEKSVLKRVMPWYSFSRKSLPVILEDLAKRPSKLTVPIRAASGGLGGDEDFVPNWIGEGAAVPIPGAPEGFGRFVSSFGLPFEDESIKALGSFARGDMGRGFGQVLGSAVPWLKYPIEVTTGKQLHTGRELRDLRPTGVGSLGGALPDEYAGPLSQVLANTPASRFITTIDKIADTVGPSARKGVLPTAVNLLTGARVTDVDLEKSKQIEGRKLLEQILGEDPQLRRFQKFYPAEAEKDRLSPETVDFLRLSEGLRQKAHTAAVASRAEKGDAEAKKELERIEKRKLGMRR